MFSHGHLYIIKENGKIKRFILEKLLYLYLMTETVYVPSNKITHDEFILDCFEDERSIPRILFK